MLDYKPWDIVKVPFPYRDRPVREWRPALVVSAGSNQERHGLLWVMMITSAGNQQWPGDVTISNLAQAGLPAASLVRTAKIATIEAKEATRIGSLPEADRDAVRAQLEEILAN